MVTQTIKVILLTHGAKILIFFGDAAYVVFLGYF